MMRANKFSLGVLLFLLTFTLSVNSQSLNNISAEENPGLIIKLDDKLLSAENSFNSDIIKRINLYETANNEKQSAGENKIKIYRPNKVIGLSLYSKGFWILNKYGFYTWVEGNPLFSYASSIFGGWLLSHLGYINYYIIPYYVYPVNNYYSLWIPPLYQNTSQIHNNSIISTGVSNITESKTERKSGIKLKDLSGLTLNIYDENKIAKRNILEYKLKSTSISEVSSSASDYRGDYDSGRIYTIKTFESKNGGTNSGTVISKGKNNGKGTVSNKTQTSKKKSD